MSFFFLALLLPETGEARCSAQFERLRLLLLRNLDGLMKTRFGFRLGVRDWGLGLVTGN